MEKLKVSIIIVNWNGYRDTIECLSSLQKLETSNFEIIVIDNGSTDNSIIKIKKAFPKQLIIENKNNLGFAQGNNIGIEYALAHGTEAILLLNNDTVVSPDFLDKLVENLWKEENIGIVGPLIYYYQKKDIWWQGGNFDFWYNFRDRISNNLNKSYESSFISGCTLLIKREVIEKIGLLDERFFLYYEDADWCFRARKSGYKCVIVPKSKIWHKVSSTSGSSLKPDNQYYFIRNKLLFAQKNLESFRFIVFFLLYLCKFTVKAIILFIIDFKRFKFHIRGLIDFIRRKFGKLEELKL